MSEVEPNHWTTGKAECYGCAGAALAVVLVLLQIKIEDGFRVASLFCSAVSIPIWLVLAQLSTAMEAWWHKPAVRVALSTELAVGSVLFTSAVLLLFLALSFLIASFSLTVAFAFLIGSLSMAYFLFKFTKKLQRIVFKTPPQ